MSKKKAYVVMGDTGEYSDHRSWYLRIFLHKEVAQGLCDRLNAWCKEHGCAENRIDGDSYGPDRKHPPEDPDFQNDSTGTVYSVLELSLDDAKKFKVAKGGGK